MFIVVKREPAFSTVSYCLSPTGAQKLLDQLPVVGPIDLWLNEMNHKKKVLEVRLASPKLAAGGWDGSEFWNGNADISHGSLDTMENSTVIGALSTIWYRFNEVVR